MKRLGKRIGAVVAAAALVSSMMPASALAARVDLDAAVAESAVSSTLADGTATTNVYVMVADAFAVTGPAVSLFEEGYARGDALSSWVTGGTGALDAWRATWTYAEVLDDGSLGPVRTAAADARDVIREDESGAVEVLHYPQADGLASGKTYAYWVEVTDAAGNTMKQPTDKPTQVVREAGYRPGPFYDDVTGRNWTIAVAGGPEADGMQTGVAGGILSGSILESSAVAQGSAAYDALQQAAAAGDDALRICGAWEAQLTGADAGRDAYKGDVLVMIDTAKVPDFDAARADDYTVLMLKTDGSYEAINLRDAATSGLKIEDGRISFKVSGSGNTGYLGTFAVALKPTAQEVARQFSVTAETHGAGGQVQPAGTVSYAYGAAPTYTFDAYPGYQVDKVELVAEGRVIPIPHAGAGASGTYGTWSGNAYQFPADFNEAANMADVRFEVTFGRADAYEGETDALSLTVTAGTPPSVLDTVPNGGVYVGTMGAANLVRDGARKTFKTTSVQDRYAIVPNAPLTLFFAPDDGCRVARLAINGEEIVVAGSSYTIPAMNESMDVRVEFERAPSGPVTTRYYTVRAVYDDMGGRVGFGFADGAEWVMSKQVGEGDAAVFTVQPRDGWHVAAAEVYATDGTFIVDATGWLTSAGTLTIPNVRQNINVEFEFAEGSVDPGPGPDDPIKPGDPDSAWVIVTTEYTAGGSMTPSLTVERGSTARIWLFPEAGHNIAQVTVGGKDVRDIADGSVSYDFTSTKPFIELKGVQDSVSVKASFVEDANAPDWAPTIPVEPEQPDSGGTITPGDGNLVYEGEGQTFTFVPENNRFVLDVVDVDGVRIFDDDVELKDDPDALAAAGMAYENGVYTAKNGDRFTFDTVTGTLTFDAITAPHQVAGAFARIKDLHVEVTSTGGSVEPSGIFTWKTKKGLTILIVPESDHEIDRVLLDGSDITAELEEAAEGQQASHVSSLLGVRTIARDAGGLRTLADEAQARLAAGKAYSYTIAPEYLANAGERVHVDVRFKPTSSTDNPTDSFTVTARVQGGHGSIEGAGADGTLSIPVEAGGTASIGFKPDTGYVVSRVTDNGVEVKNWTQTAYIITGVDANHDVVVEFKATSQVAIPQTPARVIRQLQSLAKTGDLTAPAATFACAIACAAFGVALLAANRRRKQDD